jgi:uncharacterized protein (TIGR02646 family)
VSERPPQKDAAVVVVRTPVAVAASYQDYRPALRWDFWYSCAYCTLSEVEAAGIGFEIDHFLPQSRYPELDREYTNLYWSCRHCNRHKSSFAPTKVQSVRGQEILRADREHPRDHLVEAEDNPNELRPLTAKGEFNIERLDLNRPTLVKLRRIRRRLADANATITLGVADVLRHGLDGVRREHKGLLLRLHGDARELQQQATQTVADFIRSCLRSDLLDAAQEPRARTQYLRKLGALVPSVPPQHIQPARARGRGRRRRR